VTDLSEWGEHVDYPRRIAREALEQAIDGDHYVRQPVTARQVEGYLRGQLALHAHIGWGDGRSHCAIFERIDGEVDVDLGCILCDDEVLCFVPIESALGLAAFAVGVSTVGRVTGTPEPVEASGVVGEVSHELDQGVLELGRSCSLLSVGRHLSHTLTVETGCDRKRRVEPWQKAEREACLRSHQRPLRSRSLWVSGLLRAGCGIGRRLC
jgi:hypothetical protein